MTARPAQSDRSYLSGYDAAAPLRAYVPALAAIHRLGTSSPGTAWEQLCALRADATRLWWYGHSPFGCACRSSVPEALIEYWLKDAKEADPLAGDRDELRAYPSADALLVDPFIEAALGAWRQTAERVTFMAEHGAFDDEIAYRLCLSQRGVLLLRVGWPSRRRRADRWTRERILISFLLWRYCFGEWPTSTDWEPTRLRRVRDRKRLRRWLMPLAFSDSKVAAEVTDSSGRQPVWPRCKDVYREFDSFDDALVVARSFEYAVVFAPLEGWHLRLLERKRTTEVGSAVAFIERLQIEEAELYDDVESFRMGWTPRHELLEFLERVAAFDRRLSEPPPTKEEPAVVSDVPF